MYKLLFKQNSIKKLESFQQITIKNKQTLYGNLQDIVSLPENEDKNEWIALNICEFQAQIQLVVSFIQDECQKQTCEMTAGSYSYTWPATLRHVKLPASEYIKKAIDENNLLIKNQQMFPLNFSGKFPKDFTKICSIINRRIFRIYAHIYYTHLGCFSDNMVALNTYFQHFIMFTQEFELLDQDEMEVLSDVIQDILKEANNFKQPQQQNVKPEAQRIGDTMHIEDTHDIQIEKQIFNNSDFQELSNDKEKQE
ncbi:Mob1-like protein [Spironucleus salmonicida]|uniref:Mob1-like protein n=1 Tax=Spironucleus salmonicida TaxID=348837 RepID=V6LBA3_9EUKA|nr:Mob1-like protein [Spironucleus salmonicida]|eukprot:EST41720.1 Mob1-like protein [Spironucleus salmonicida]